VSLWGGRSRSVSVAGDPTSTEGASSAVPTKQHRVLISSMSASVRSSCGTRVARLEAGIFAVALREVGGGR
jgi:hypothetical protein